MLQAGTAAACSDPEAAQCCVSCSPASGSARPWAMQGSSCVKKCFIKVGSVAKHAFPGAGVGQLGSARTCPPTNAGEELERPVLCGSRSPVLPSQTHKQLLGLEGLFWHCVAPAIDIIEQRPVPNRHFLLKHPSTHQK